MRPCILVALLCCLGRALWDVRNSRGADEHPAPQDAQADRDRVFDLPFDDYAPPEDMVPPELRDVQDSFAYSMRDLTDDPQRGLARFLSIGPSDLQSGPWRRYAGISAVVHSGDVVPCLGELYLVGLPLDGVRMERVSEFVSEELLPVPDALNVLPQSSTNWLFWNRNLRVAGSIELLGISDDTGKRAAATIEVNPPPNREAIIPGRRPRSRPDTFYARTPFTLTVRAGDLVATEFQAYRVRNVVPPHEIKLPDGRTGRVVGWVEIDPEPLPPPEDPAVAPEEETE